MRNNFINKLIDLAKKDPRIVLLTGDLGFSVLEEFMKKFPDRFYNVGVAEQNMLGIATGLAEAGFIPFVYSIASFAILRPYEFIRNGAILHNLPVRIIGIGAGFEYGNLGTTHHLIEDIAILRLFPNLTIYSPINSQNAGNILTQSYQENFPIYYRIGKNQNSLSDNFDYQENSHLTQLSHHQGKICVFGIGSIIEEIILAINQSTIKFSSFAITKIDNQLAKKLLPIIKSYEKIITIEAHYINGGIGSIIAEIIAENQLHTRLHRLGVRELSDGIFGDTKFMLKKHKIDCESLVDKLKCLEQNL
jgi:transketolase